MQLNVTEETHHRKISSTLNLTVVCITLTNSSNKRAPEILSRGNVKSFTGATRVLGCIKDIWTPSDAKNR